MIKSGAQASKGSESGLRVTVYCLRFTVYCLLFTVYRLLLRGWEKLRLNMKIGRFLKNNEVGINCVDFYHDSAITKQA